ncbi:hypothetical protein E1193_08925 [Micromonospora sp. KC606]|uniref:hypothetical protein n=1 Tax=Micromonospora sp. KC606 TaxID=2530379 RepID=UPI00104CD8B3|nr:hypothetical protein [Micromonospora sp. KC606]TDC83350.1 hypothetical protein E1193_08925 [Micromonospora sp. KC606]
MSLESKIAICAVVVVTVGAGAAAVLGGVIPMSRNTHPPCGELPTTAEATAALTRNQAFATDIEALGKGISVNVGSPCPKGQDRALIQVTYGSKPEREAIDSLLARRDGFGVPMYLVEK